MGGTPHLVNDFHCATPGYTQLKFLQKGGYGAAYLEQCNATGEKVAIKYIKRGSKARRRRRRGEGCATGRAPSGRARARARRARRRWGASW